MFFLYIIIFNGEEIFAHKKCGRKRILALKKDKKFKIRGGFHLGIFHIERILRIMTEDFKEFDKLIREKIYQM